MYEELQPDAFDYLKGIKDIIDTGYDLLVGATLYSYFSS